MLWTSCLRFLTKRPAIRQQLYKTASHGLSAIAELLVTSCDGNDAFWCHCPSVTVTGAENTGLYLSRSVWKTVRLFSHLIYFVQLLYLGKLSRPKYQQKLNKIMEISQEDVILIKNLHLSKQYGARRLLRELPDNFEASTVSWREATRLVQLSRFQAALNRICRVAVKDLVLNQEDKPKRHRSAR